MKSANGSVLLDVKEITTPLFEKSKGRRPKWCGQFFLGWVGYLLGEILTLQVPISTYKFSKLISIHFL